MNPTGSGLATCVNVCVCMHVPFMAITCLTRGRGEDRVGYIPHLAATTLYIHTPLAPFKATHSCGNVSIVTA